jgi:hypothetical protein
LEQIKINNGRGDFQNMKGEISMENNKFKKEMIFALIWIGTYFLLVILANILSNVVIKIIE